MLFVESAEVMEEKSAETGVEWEPENIKQLRRSDLLSVILTVLPSESSRTRPMVSEVIVPSSLISRNQ